MEVSITHFSLLLKALRSQTVVLKTSNSLPTGIVMGGTIGGAIFGIAVGTAADTAVGRGIPAIFGDAGGIGETAAAGLEPP